MATVRQRLDGYGKSVKFSWISSRLMVLRNIIIALAIVVSTMLVAAMLLREAYRQTLTIVAFDVPSSISQRGITGEVAARNLFNELLKRRKSITSFDAGTLTSLSAERQSDIASGDGKYSLQSIFRYFRHLTGRETTVDGEMLVDGDAISVTARVSGHPQRTVRGSIADWESLLGDLANYVFESTQPIVLIGYLGETAKTPADLAAISRLIQKLVSTSPRVSETVLATAYHAYGEALARQGRREGARVAWAQARAYDPKLVRPYWSAALDMLRDSPTAAEQLFRQAEALETDPNVKLKAIALRLSTANNRSDCKAAKDAIAQAQRLRLAREFENDPQWLRYVSACEYQHANAVAHMRKLTLLHPENAGYWNFLGLILAARSDRKYMFEARDAAIKAVAADTNKRIPTVRNNLARYHAALGELDTAEAVYKSNAGQLVENTNQPRRVMALIRAARGDHAEAERLLTLNVEDPSSVSGADYRYLIAVLDAQGKLDRMIEMARAGQQRFPLYCPLYNDTASILMRHQRVAEADAQWEAGLRAIPKCDLNYLNYAKALMSRDKRAEAKALLERLVRTSPASDGADVAGELLAGLASVK